MVRSILLRGFDLQMAEMVGDYMAKHKVGWVVGFKYARFCFLFRKSSFCFLSSYLVDFSVGQLYQGNSADED